MNPEGKSPPFPEAPRFKGENGELVVDIEKFTARIKVELSQFADELGIHGFPTFHEVTKEADAYGLVRLVYRHENPAGSVDLYFERKNDNWTEPRIVAVLYDEKGRLVSHDVKPLLFEKLYQETKKEPSI